MKDRPIARAVKALVVIALSAAGLCGCQPGAATRTASAGGAVPQRPSEAAYRAPPTITRASLDGAERLKLEGEATAGTRVRLASPGGKAILVTVDPAGVWRASLINRGSPQLLGLSMISADRVVQAEGYVVVTPEATAAQLRAGAGALVIRGKSGHGILAVDFDSKGGAVVSGLASPRAPLVLMVDGVARARGAAGADGRFAIPLDEPLSLADHRLEVVDGARQVSAAARLSPASPLSSGPYRAARTADGWRIDWLTPGGGLQSTLITLPDRIAA